MRNVIVLGLSQHGKTTFMNGLQEYQGGHRSGDGAVGDGTSRCTERPSIYHLHAPGKPTMMLSYTPLFDPSKVDMIAKVDEQDLEKLDAARRKFWKDRQRDDEDFQANVMPLNPCQIGCNLIDGAGRLLGMAFFGPSALPVLEECLVSELAICALDTPGIEDSKGQDDEHIEAVISAVLDMETLSGLVMVTKCGCPITPAWKSQVSRYWNLFPMMKSQWIFVHTNADPYASSNPQRRKQSSFETASQDRSDVVNAAMRELTGYEEFDAAHIFVESDVEDRECLGSFLAHQHNMLFTLVCNFSPVNVQTLTFEKGPALLAMDARLISALESTIDAVTATLLEVDKELGMLLKLRNANAQGRSGLDISLQTVQNNLGELDHGGIVQEVKYVSRPWRFWYYPEASVQMDTQHSKYEVSIIDTEGTGLKHVSTQVAVDLPDGKKRLRIDVQLPHVFRNLAGKIVVTSKSTDVYELRIADLKHQKEDLGRQFAAMMRSHEAAEDLLAVKSKHAASADRRHKTAQAAKQFVSSPWPMHTWKAMKPFYEEFKGVGSPDAHGLVTCFQHWWVRFLAADDVDLGFQPEEIVLLELGVAK